MPFDFVPIPSSSSVVNSGRTQELEDSVADERSKLRADADAEGAKLHTEKEKLAHWMTHKHDWGPAPEQPAAGGTSSALAASASAGASAGHPSAHPTGGLAPVEGSQPTTAATSAGAGAAPGAKRETTEEKLKHWMTHEHQYGPPEPAAAPSDPNETTGEKIKHWMTHKHDWGPPEPPQKPSDPNETTCEKVEHWVTHKHDYGPDGTEDGLPGFTRSQ